MGMTDAAVLGAEDVIGPRFVRGKPEMGRHARNAILLDAVGGNEQAVEDIDGRHEEFHRPSHRNIQDIALPAVVIGEQPGPLAGGHMDGQGILRRVADVFKIHPAEVKHEDDEDRGNDGPDDLQQDILLHMLRPGVPLPVVLDQKDNHGDRDDGQQDHAADHDEDEGIVHFSRRIGRSREA